MKKESFRVTGMTCAACARHVKRAAESVEGVKDCAVMLLQNKMTVIYDETVTKATVILEAVTRQGYPAFREAAAASADIGMCAMLIFISSACMTGTLSFGNDTVPVMSIGTINLPNALVAMNVFAAASMSM